MIPAASSSAGSRIRFGCCGSMISPATDPIGIEIVEQLAGLGFDYIELSLRDLVLLTESSLTSLAGRVREAGLTCEVCNNFFPPEIRFTGPAADHPGALRYAERALATAARLGAKAIVFGSSGSRNFPDGFPRDQAWIQLRRLLAALGPLAEKHGITLAIEHLRREESNILNTVTESWRLAQEVAHPNIRLLADSYHLQSENENPSIIADVAPAIAHVHAAQGTARVFPDGSDSAFAGFFAALCASGYSGRCSIEAYTADFPADAARGLRACRELSNSAPI